MADPFARGKRGGRRPVEDPEDTFVETTVRFWIWIQHSARSVLLGLVALGALVAGTVYYLGYRQTVRERAAMELQRIRASRSTEPLTLATQLESLVNRYDGTPSADEGRLLLARIQLDFGQTEEVIRTLEGAERGLDQPLGVGARNLLATAYEQIGDLDRALAILDEVATGARYPFQRRLARAGRARILADDGRLDEAAAIYEELAGETDDILEQSQYRVRLGEVRALQQAAIDEAAPAPVPDSDSEPEQTPREPPE